MRTLRFGLALALLCTSSLCAANGRFPRGEHLLEDPADAKHLVLAATYGLVVTSDRGASWHHVCERAFAELGSEADPVAAFSANGSLIASLHSSLGRGSGDGCGFVTTLGAGSNEVIPDFTLEAQSADRAVAVVATLYNGKTVSYRLEASSDGGKTWQVFGAPLPDAIQLVTTIDVAPSDPNRIYVTGLGAGDVGLLLRSDDRGESFSVTQLATSAPDAEAPYIAAIGRSNSNVLYVRTDAWLYEGTSGIFWAGDRLLYSEDGGGHFREAMKASAKLLGFALSPDESELLLGYGDPVEEGGRLTKPEALGIYRGRADGSELTRVFGSATSCLTWTEHSLYACTQQADLGASLVSIAPTSLTLGGDPKLQPLLRVEDIAGPVQCSACDSSSVCQDSWRAVCLGWGRDDCDTPASPKEDCTSAAGAGGAENGGAPATANAGSPDESGAPPIARAGARGVIVGRPKTRGDDEGCGCRMGTRGVPVSAAALCLWATAALWRRRRR